MAKRGTEANILLILFENSAFLIIIKPIYCRGYSVSNTHKDYHATINDARSHKRVVYIFTTLQTARLFMLNVTLSQSSKFEDSGYIDYVSKTYCLTTMAQTESPANQEQDNGDTQETNRPVASFSMAQALSRIRKQQEQEKDSEKATQRAKAKEKRKRRRQNQKIARAKKLGEAAKSGATKTHDKIKLFVPRAVLLKKSNLDTKRCST